MERGRKSREAREGEERVSKLVFCFVGLPYACQQKKAGFIVNIYMYVKCSQSGSWFIIYVCSLVLMHLAKWKE